MFEVSAWIQNGEYGIKITGDEFDKYINVISACTDTPYLEEYDEETEDSKIKPLVFDDFNNFIGNN